MTCRLLVVDDEPDAVELLCEIRDGEYNSRFAASGEEAFALLAAGGADERILLPCDNGRDERPRSALRRSQAMAALAGHYDHRLRRRRQSPTIADNRRQSLENSASEFVTKPVDFEHLKKTLRSYSAGEGN